MDQGGKKHKHVWRNERKVDTGLQKLKRPFTPKRETNIKIDDDDDQGGGNSSQMDLHNKSQMKHKNDKEFKVLYAK